jgi:FkbM family methyltransferase
LARLAIWRVRCSAGKGVFVPAHGASTTIYCPPEWRGNAKLSYVMRGAIEPDLSIAVALVEPGSLIVDVGAHYGAFTLPLAHAVGPEGAVVAVEPNPAARIVLNKGVAANGMSNVAVEGCALGSESGSAVLQIPEDPSRASLAIAHTGEGVSDTEVNVRTLDELLAHRTRPVRLLKVDVEGHEREVIRGAIGVILADRPIILFEDLPALQVGADGRSPASILRELGFEIREFWQGTWREVLGAEHFAKNLWAFPAANRDTPLPGGDDSAQIGHPV